MAKKKIIRPPSAKRASKIEQTDAALSTALVRYRDNPAIRVVGGLAELADQPPLIAASLATVAAGAALGRPRLTRAGLRMLASELLATALKAAIKHHVNRTRPHKMLEDGRYSLHTDKKGSKDQGPWNSFPSGHTAGAVAVGRALVREYPAVAPVAGLAMTAVALIQLPRGAHFASDIAAGAAVGAAAEGIVHAGATRLGRSLVG